MEKKALFENEKGDMRPGRQLWAGNNKSNNVVSEGEIQIVTAQQR